MKNPKADELRRRILILAASPKGFAPRMIPEANATVLGDLCRALVKKGMLYRAPLGHRTVLWFTTSAAAKRAEDSANAVKAQRYERASEHKPRLLPDLPVVIPAGIVVQVGPAFVPRFQGHVGACSFGLQRGRVTP